MQKLKSYLPMILAGVAAICAGDVATGLHAGKSLLNVQMLPSLAIGGGSVATLFMKWINSRYVSARVIAPQISDEFRNEVEALFQVAADTDVPEELVESLAKIAGAKILAYRRKSAEGAKT